MLLETFPVGPLACNCTILGDEETREAIVIDPGDDVSRIFKRLTEQGLKLKQILVTHGHIDHVGGALKLKRLTGAPIYLNENDLPQLDIMDTQAAWVGLATPPETAPPDESLAEGQVVGLENYPAKVLHTPGHTQGSICLHFAPVGSVDCRGHALCRQHRPHRSAGRQLWPDHGLAALPPVGPARRNPGAPRPRPGHHNRPGAGLESLPESTRPLAESSTERAQSPQKL